MKTNAKISFRLIDVTAKSDSILSVNDKQDFVDLDDLKSDEVTEIKYGTLEKNQFALDGTFELMPDTLSNMCLWSKSMSNENCNFETPLTLEINFTETHSSPGITFLFSKAGDYCNNLNIKYYDDEDTLISDVNFKPNSYEYIASNIVENFKKIIITFYSTNNPYRYLKLYKILYGYEKVFNEDTLMSANLIEETDFISSELSINTLDFEVYSEDDDFNIINPKGVYNVLQERQKIEVVEELLAENKEIKMGTFYLDTWTSEKDNLMKFSAIDLIGLLDKTTFYGGFYENIYFEDLIEEIMTSAGFTEEDYEIQEELKSIIINGYLPVCTHREALQQAVFVACAIVDNSRGDIIKIYRLDSKTDVKTFNSENIFESTRETSRMDVVTGVSLTIHKYEQPETPEAFTKGDLEEVASAIVILGKNIIVFDEPIISEILLVDLTIATSSTSETTDGRSILVDSNCNSATIFLSAEYAGEQMALVMAQEAYLSQYR